MFGIGLSSLWEIFLDKQVWSDQTMQRDWPMYITNITEAKAHFSALIEKVLAGEEIIIGKSGKPVAKLIRYECREESRQPGALKGKIKIADNSDELPEDIAKAFGIRTD